MQNPNYPNPPFHLETMIRDFGLPADAVDDSHFADSTVVYEISRLEVEHCLIDRIIHDFRISTRNPFCHCGMDKVLFSVQGYDADPRELFQIPEFRSFVRALGEHEIPWTYFACLESRWLQVLALCLVNNAAALTDMNRQRTRMAFSGQGVAEFLEAQLDSFSAMCAFNRVTQEAAETRFRDVCASFGFGWPGESEC